MVSDKWGFDIRHLSPHCLPLIIRRVPHHTTS
jgi:hypothetical protein